MITTPFTFVTTAEVTVLLGAVPVFVDIEPDTCSIDASKIKATITPDSLYGQPADMEEINAVAARHGLAVIEDAAQSFGAEYKGRKSCNQSTIGWTSFFPSEPLGCYGDGGAIFTSDDALAKAMREIRIHGQEKRYVHSRIGVDGRMDTLQCAVVLAKLERFDWEVEQRLKIGARYNELLVGTVPVVTPRPDRASVFAHYTAFIENREQAHEKLKAAEIPTAVHYPVPLQQQAAYKDHCRVHCGVHLSEETSARVMSLPMNADLAAIHLRQIVQALTSATN